MILVDSSVWIDYFNGVDTVASEKLDRALYEDEVAIGDLMLVEVLQGFSQSRDFNSARQLFSALPCVNLTGTAIALKSAENFRFLRARGLTVRKTIDTVIATYCIENQLDLLFSDRDFQPFVEYLGLRQA